MDSDSAYPGEGNKKPSFVGSDEGTSGAGFTGGTRTASLLKYVHQRPGRIAVSGQY